jgi:sigma-54 dependent transcriptional regulator, acetoin dehydrogenase operon transcriptional activator AcoR
MASGGIFREPALEVIEGGSPRSTRDRAHALVAAIETLQQRTDISELTEAAALGALSLTAAGAAVAYFDSPDLGPQLAVAGTQHSEAAQALVSALRDLLSSATAAQYAFLAGASTVVAPFHAGSVRGGVLAHRDTGAFDDVDGRLLSQFARHVGTAAAAVALLARCRRVDRIEQVVLEALHEGVLLAVDGRIKVLNRAAARILGADPRVALGASLQATWPELAALVDAGEPLENEPVRAGGKQLHLTLRPLPETKPRVAAILNFVDAEGGESRPRRTAAQPLSRLEDLVGGSSAIAAIRELALVAANSSSSLVIEGESGVGKEILAQSVHSGGPRRRSAFLAVHCAAIPRELLESELFGYEPGAFTGASPRGHAGKFELAEGGTLLLDDVVELPLDMQAKLLRVLEEKCVTRLGGSRARPLDVRITATSNVPLRDAVRAGRFRADLFYRLDVLHISVPPLRDRPEDIRPLAERFLRKYSAEHGRQLRTIGPDALLALQSYRWPGNVRELEHWIENEIHFAAPGDVCLERLTRRPAASEVAPAAPRQVRPVHEAERELYSSAIRAAHGSVSEAARTLGVSRGKVYRKLRVYSLLPR